MRALILFAHPNPRSFCAAIKQVVEESLIEQKISVDVRDLYVMGFNPVLKGEDFIAIKSGQLPADIADEQDRIRSVDLIIIICPIWWAGLPAILKGYLDRIFTFGFAFGPAPQGGMQGLLQDKKAILIHTMGNSHQSYESSGMFKSLNQTLEQGVITYSGIEILDHHYFSSIPTSTLEERHAYLNDLRHKVLTWIKRGYS